MEVTQNGDAQRLPEFDVTQGTDGSAQFIGLTPRARRWIDLHGGVALVARVNVLRRPGESLVVLLGELLEADLAEEEREAYRRLSDLAARQRRAQR